MTRNKGIKNEGMVRGVPAIEQWVSDLACLCGSDGLISSLVQWGKDPALPQPWCSLPMWLRFSLWPGNFHMLWMWPKKQKKKKKKFKSFWIVILRVKNPTLSS